MRRLHAVLRRRERRKPSHHRLAAVGVQHRVRHGAAGGHAGGLACSPVGKSILDTISAEITALQAPWAATRRPSSTPTSDSIRRSRTSCSPPPRRRASHAPSQPPLAPTAPISDERLDALAANADPPADHRHRLRLRHHPGGLSAVGQRSEADGQRAVQLRPALRRSARRVHPQRRRLELRQPGEVRGLPGDPVRQPHQLVEGAKDPLDSTGRRRCSTTRWWSGRATWATRRTTISNRCASFWPAATTGISSWPADGRYVKSTERHERILLNICDAFGITSYAGFGDPGLTGASKAPLPGIAV